MKVPIGNVINHVFEVSIPVGAIEGSYKSRSFFYSTEVSIPVGAIEGLRQIKSSSCPPEVSIPVGAIEGENPIRVQRKRTSFNTRRCD